MSEHLGIHINITLNGDNIGGVNSRLPEQFVIEGDPTREIRLSAPARGVQVQHNRKPQIRTTPEAPNKDYVHETNTDLITFSFDLLDKDVVTVYPID